MSAKSFFLGIILARGGSKRLPNKNIKLLRGHPMLSYVINAGKKSKLLDDVLVSTDSNEIQQIALSYGACAPFLRPATLATDSATSEDALRHAVLEYEKITNTQVDYVVMLQPTSPLTQSETIDICIKKILDNNASTLFTITKPNKRCEWIGSLDNSYFKLLVDRDVFLEYASIDQYAPSGNIYILKREALFSGERIILTTPLTHLVQPDEAIDIDYEFDFKIAEYLIDLKQKSN